MQLRIEYPALVEQAYAVFLSRGITGISKLTIFNELVNQGLLTKNGQPTQKAFDEGLVESAEGDPIKRFKVAYPVMANIPDQHFKVQDGHVLMDGYAVRMAASTVLNDPTSTEEQRNIAWSLLDRLADAEDSDNNEWY